MPQHLLYWELGFKHPDHSNDVELMKTPIVLCDLTAAGHGKAGSRPHMVHGAQDSTLCTVHLLTSLTVGSLPEEGFRSALQGSQHRRRVLKYMQPNRALTEMSHDCRETQEALQEVMDNPVMLAGVCLGEAQVCMEVQKKPGTNHWPESA